MNLGTTAMNTLKLGTTQVTSAYIGSTSVWSAVVMDADATAYFARVVAAGSSISAANQTAVNAFIVGCKADGTWSVMKCVGLLCAANSLAGALVSLKGPNLVNYNFIEADYSRTTGLKGNGTTKYIDTQFASTSMAQNNIHCAIYQTEGSSGGGWPIGYGDDDRADYTVIESTGIKPRFYVQYGYQSFVSGVGITGPCMLLCGRLAQTAAYSYVHSTFNLNAYSSVSPRGSSRFGVFAAIISSGGTTYQNGYSNFRISVFSIGENIGYTQLKNRLVTLMAALT